MAVNDFVNLPRASFSGIEFPYESLRVHGGLRKHVHEYPHVPGGDAEKLGRKLYEFEFTALFHTTFTGYGSNLWPKRLADLRKLFESELTAELTVPTIGKVQAFCDDWTQEQSGKSVSGERATFKFIEDQESAFLVDSLISIEVNSLDQKLKNFQYETSALAPQPSIFDEITNAVNKVLAVVDQIDAYGAIIEAKLLAVAELCKEADARLDLLQDVTRVRILEALKELWASALSLHQNVQRKLGVVETFIVPPGVPTISDVSTRLFGAADQAMDLLLMNAIEDPFNIPPGTRINFYRV